MYSELFKKDNNSILKYLQKLGENMKIYSECRHGIGPLFPDTDAYIYATEEEIAIVLINPDKKLPIAFPLIFLYEAEFTETDYAYAGYSLLSLVDPDISHDERDEEMNYLREEFGLDS